MPPSYVFKEAPIERIVRSDSAFLLPSKKSTEKWTLFEATPLNPIWLQSITDTSYRIVDGFRTVDRLRQNEKNGTIPAFVFNKNEPKFDLWKLRIQKRLLEGNFPVFPIVEQLYRFGEAENFALDDTLAKIFDEAKVPLRKFDRSLVERIGEGASAIGSFSDIDELDYKELRLLGRFTTEEIGILADLFRGLQLKGNKLSSILQTIDELKNGFGISLRDILADQTVAKIVAETRNGGKYAKLKSRLVLLRHPILNRLRSDWSRMKKELDPPAEIRLENDPQFESDTLRIVMEVESPEQLENAVRWMEKKLAAKEMDGLFDFV